MKIIEYANIEVIPQVDHEESAMVANRRMKQMVKDSREQKMYVFAPKESATSDSPAYPCEDYGD